MKVSAPKIPHHWSYFLCLEEDVAHLSRWVEFAEANFQCYSIEIARLLMSVSAEVDVIAKQVCQSINASSTANNIHAYQSEITAAFPNIPKANSAIPKHGIELHPWQSWATENSAPDWWSANNLVKHQRSEHFHRASLENLLNSMSGLLILLTLLYRSGLNYYMHPHSTLFIPRSFMARSPKGDGSVLFTEWA